MSADPKLGDKDYPYWIDQFNKEYKGYELWFYESVRDYKGRKHSDTADAYRVFMIACNNLCGWEYEDNTRMDVVNKLKAATEDNPLEINGEFFFSVKEDE